MDSRVTALIEDMEEGRISHPDGSLDCDALNDRIKALHPRLGDEESRVELLRLHDALMRTSDRRLVEQGRDPEPLREEWRRSHLSFILAESLTGGEVDQAKLARVQAREIAAGRLHPDAAIQIRKAEPAAAGGDGAAELERAYRALLLWRDEKMAPRVEALVDNFRAWLDPQERGPDLRAAADNERLALGRWFEENEKGFVAEAVSYLDDEMIGRLKALGVDGQFGAALFDAIDEARADLARRLGEALEAAAG